MISLLELYSQINPGNKSGLKTESYFKFLMLNSLFNQQILSKNAKNNPITYTFCLTLF